MSVPTKEDSDMQKIGRTIGAVSVVMALNIPVEAKPVEYVKVCSAYGTSYFYHLKKK